MQPVTTEDVSLPRRSRGGNALRRVMQQSGIVLVFLILVVLLAVLVPDFMTRGNVVGLLLSVTLTGTIAATMMLVLALGEVDLSVASTVAFAGVVASVAADSLGAPLGILIGVLAGGAVGFCNGVVVAKFGVNSLIATLAAMEIVRGLAYITSGGDAVMILAPGFFSLASYSFLGLSAPVWVMFACFVVFGIVLNYTVFGRDVLAIGGNVEAARLAGLPVDRIRILVFVLQGLLAGFAGTLLASRMGLGDPKTSIGLELGVISACVLGGVSLSGGIASISGVVVGVLIMGCVQDAMGLLNVPTFYQYLVRGGILLLAVLFDRWKTGRAASVIR
ncbi:L-arabinose ABC transporter permease AraH [Acidisoma cladoniae]|jgi:L-arabinose transport system permease protein|uniref:L-arabinose ABC transporter permease AraH n=1 Tax=Acidisoma cladoniae TaxID=3040935 RepID=UPI0025505091|nr:L-arabinose ABC transporter permease AraH [Acidisoma sp. PAMC 29798]